MKTIGYNLVFFISLLILPVASLAQTVHQELQETVKAEVTKILSEEKREIPHTSVTTTIQMVEAVVKSGSVVGKTITFENDLLILNSGDRIFINRLVSIDGAEYYQFKDVDRRFSLLWLALLFAILLIWFAGRQGLRALFSLALSVVAILFVLVPALLKGYNPIWVSLAVSGIILALVFFITHGFNRRSLIAFSGTFGAVFFTCILATFWVEAMRLTGLSSDASIYLNFSTQGELDFTGLLLGSIIIGILGVLDDVSITQASVVQELKAANHKLSFLELYKRAIRVGRDHVASLVNTLALAYVGVSLPLIMFLTQSDAPFGMIINQELVATEMLRIMVGSIGLILAVPLTTLLAAWWFARFKRLPHPDSATHRHH